MERYQEEKSEMGSIAQETFSNVRTVKAFADENGSAKLYNLKNLKMFFASAGSNLSFLTATCFK